MNTRSIFLAVATVLLMVNLQCVSPTATSGNQGAHAVGKGEAAVTEGRGRLGVVRLPEPFARADAGGGAKVITGGFEARLLSDVAPGELLFAGRDYDKTYSDNVYAVSLDGQFRTRPATRHEWERAQTLKTGGEQVSAVENDTERPNTAVISNKPSIAYRGRTFARTGAAWTSRGALASPDGRWLAVFSHTTETRDSGGALPGSGGAGKGDGVMFVDVYDTSSGEKVMAGRAPHSGGQFPGYDFNSAVWVEDRYLIVPTSFAAPGANYFLGIVPSG